MRHGAALRLFAVTGALTAALAACDPASGGDRNAEGLKHHKSRLTEDHRPTILAIAPGADESWFDALGQPTIMLSLSATGNAPMAAIGCDIAVDGQTVVRQAPVIGGFANCMQSFTPPD